MACNQLTQSKDGFLSNGVPTASLKACGLLIIFKIETLINDRSNHVGMGSKRHVGGLEKVITEVKSGRSIGQKGPKSPSYWEPISHISF